MADLPNGHHAQEAGPSTGTVRSSVTPAGRWGVFHPRTPSQWVVFIVASCFMLFLFAFVALFGLTLFLALVSLVETLLTRGLQSLA